MIHDQYSFIFLLEVRSVTKISSNFLKIATVVLTDCFEGFCIQQVYQDLRFSFFASSECLRADLRYAFRDDFETRSRDESQLLDELILGLEGNFLFRNIIVFILLRSLIDHLPGVLCCLFWVNKGNTGASADDDIRQIRLHHFLESLIQSFRKVVDPLYDSRPYRIVGVVNLAIIPNELEVIEHFLNQSILGLPQLAIDSAQIHRIFDVLRVIMQSHGCVMQGLPL